MITEDDLRRTLRTHERLAPDAASVAARITAGVRARRRHRYAGSAAVAVATAVAVGVPTLVLRDGGPAPDRAPVQVAASSPAQRPTAAPTVRFAALTVPFTVGWLPAGWHEDGLMRTRPGDAQRTYENMRAGTQQIVVRLWDIELSGAPATDVLPGQSRPVRRQISGTVWLAVAGPLSDMELDRVLRSVDVRDPEAIKFPFRATWLPADYRVTAAQGGLRHWLGNAAGDTVAADPPLVDAGLSLDRDRQPTGEALTVEVSTENGMWQDKGLLPNGTLLGRPSHYSVSDGLVRLHVYGVHGMHISIYASAYDRPELTRAVVERIARGLRLVGSPDRPADWTDRPLP